MDINEKIAIIAHDYGYSERTVLNYYWKVAKLFKEKSKDIEVTKEDLLECVEKALSTQMSLAENYGSNHTGVPLDVIIEYAVKSYFNVDCDFKEYWNKELEENYKKYIDYCTDHEKIPRFR